MPEFAYNNARNTSIGLIPFKLNCSFYARRLYKKNFNSQSKFQVIDIFAKHLGELAAICKKNLQHTQKFQKNIIKKSRSKGVTPRRKKSGSSANISGESKIGN